MTGVVPSRTFQLKVWLLAPSANPVMGMALMLPSVSGVVGTVMVSPVANAVAPALIVKLSGPETKGVPTVATPMAPETEPTPGNGVALVAVMVTVWATVAALAGKVVTVPLPTLDPP